MRLGLLSEYPLSGAPGWPATAQRIGRALAARGIEVCPLNPVAQGPRWLRPLLRLAGRPPAAEADEVRLAEAARAAEAAVHAVDAVLSVMGSRLLGRMRCARPLATVTDATWSLLRRDYPEHRQAAFLREATEIDVMRRAELQVYSSAWARRSAVADYGVPEERTMVAPFGANLEPEEPFHDARGVERRDRCELLFVGRDWHRKGGDVALAALAELRARGLPARLTIVGEPPPESAGLPSAALRVLGWLESGRASKRARLGAAFARSDLLLLPTRADCTPIAVAEAGAFGLPTVSRDVGGLAEMVRPGVNGLLLERGADARAFADRIEELWRNPDLRASLRRGARHQYELSLNWDAWAAAVEPGLRRLAA